MSKLIKYYALLGNNNIGQFPSNVQQTCNSVILKTSHVVFLMKHDCLLGLSLAAVVCELWESEAKSRAPVLHLQGKPLNPISQLPSMSGWSPGMTPVPSLVFPDRWGGLENTWGWMTAWCPATPVNSLSIAAGAYMPSCVLVRDIPTQILPTEPESGDSYYPHHYSHLLFSYIIHPSLSHLLCSLIHMLFCTYYSHLLFTSITHTCYSHIHTLFYSHIFFPPIHMLFLTIIHTY